MQSSNEGILNKIEKEGPMVYPAAPESNLLNGDVPHGYVVTEANDEALTIELSPEQTEEYTKGILALYFDYYEKYKSHRTARRKLGKKINIDPKDIRTIVLLNT